MINNYRILLSVVFLATFLWYPFIAAAQTDVKDIQALIADGRLDQALQLTNTELERDTDNVNYQFLKGIILIRLNRLEEAEKVFRDITTKHPELPEPYNNLAVIYASMGDFDKARQALEQAINTHPSYATAHENMGDIYAKLASEAYNQALQLDQENITAKAKLALINDLFSLPESEQPELAKTTEPAQKQVAAASPPVEQQPAPPPPQDTSPAETRKQEETTDENPLRQQLVKNIRATVSSWAEAWSAQDVEGYLSHYSEEFTPPSGQTLSEWRRERRDRLSSPAFIRLEISDLTVEMLGPEHAQATFTQKYQSDTYGDLVTKLLLLSKRDDDWVIVQEATK